VETTADVAEISPRDPNKLAYITQTTLSVDDTADIVSALEDRFPNIVGQYAQLVQRADEIDWRALNGIRSLGLTAGASAPEVLVNEVIDAFRDHFDVTVEAVETAVENVEFKVPRVLREPA